LICTPIGHSSDDMGGIRLVNGRDDRFVELKKILRQYFISRNQLKQLLSGDLGLNLEDISPLNDTLLDTIDKIVDSVDSQNMVCDLVVAAIRARPRRSELPIWCRHRCPRELCPSAAGNGRPGTLADPLTIAQQVLEGPVFFDLDGLRKKVWATLSLEPSRVAAFGVAYEDDTVVDSLQNS